LQFPFRLDETLNIPIFQNPFYVSCFYVSAMIFYHFVGMQNVRANLITPLRIGRLADKHATLLRETFFLLAFVELGAEDVEQMVDAVRAGVS